MVKPLLMDKRNLFSHSTRKTVPMLFTLLLAAIFCLCYTNTATVSELSEQLQTLIPYNSYEWWPETIDLRYKDAEQMILPLVVPTSQENVAHDDEVDREFEDTLILPQNITKREERLAWYRRKLPEADFFKTDELAEKFHGRVLEFLNQGCTVQFFMTWFSPEKKFGKRIFFTMETLFKTHPKGCLLIISRTMDTGRGYSTLKPLIDRGFRIIAVTPDVHFLLKNTPAEDWIKGIMKGTTDPGVIPLPQNLSNLLRLAVLYKYGGVYLDTDYIILQDMSRLRNVIGAQSMDSHTKEWRRLNNAALIFDVEHPLLYDFIQEFALTFNGNRWGYNGPYLVSRVVERVGNNPAYNLTVLSPSAFYPVDWIEIQRLLKKPENDSESMWVENKINMLKDGRTFGIHLWNARIRELKIEEGSVLARLILDHCIICEDIYGS